jgi:hypothetical protein
MDKLFHNSDNGRLPSFFGYLPGRVGADQAGKLLGFTGDEITILMTNGLLKPLAKPKSNAHKFFATVYIQRLAFDLEWLTKATECIYNHHREKNARKTAHDEKEEMPLAA